MVFSTVRAIKAYLSRLRLCFFKGPLHLEVCKSVFLCTFFLFFTHFCATCLGQHIHFIRLPYAWQMYSCTFLVIELHVYFLNVHFDVFVMCFDTQKCKSACSIWGALTMNGSASKTYSIFLVCFMNACKNPGLWMQPYKQITTDTYLCSQAIKCSFL